MRAANNPPNEPIRGCRPNCGGSSFRVSMIAMPPAIRAPHVALWARSQTPPAIPGTRRTASAGSSAAAWTAGMIAATTAVAIPARAARTSVVTDGQPGSTSGLTNIDPRSWPNSNSTARPRTTPSGMPTAEPISPSRTAADPNRLTICPRVAPIARRMPMSCRRSATVTDRAL